MAAFLTNPFDGDINPGTPDGLKLYNKAIAAPEDKLSIQQKNANDIQAHFESDASDFGWGTLIGRVKIDGVNNGPTKNILTETRELTLEMIQKHACTTWGNLDPWATNLPASFTVRTIDPATHASQRSVFFRRTRSTMIAKRIKASLDKASMKSLNLEKSKFQWRDANGTIHNDGPTMLYLILTKVNPSVRVGISSLKQNLMSANLPKFQHNVIKLLDYMSEQMLQIKDKQGSHDDFTLNLFNALATTNFKEFSSFIATERNEWEISPSSVDDNVFADLLIEKVKLK